METRAYSWLTGYGGHSSSTIMMSLPKASWTSTVEAGVNLCVSPLRCDWKVTPSSVILRRPERLKTWKPPESVRIAPGQDMKRCSPPSCRISSWPGPQEEMVGVAEDDAGLEFVPEVALVEAFDRGLRADGHEDGGRDIAMRGVQNAGAGAGLRAFGEEFEGDLREATPIVLR